MTDPETIDGTATDMTGNELVIQDDDTSAHGMFVAVNRHDEDLIVAEIRGELLETMAYEFEVGGKKARGLSYEGVNSTVQTMNARGIARIKCPPVPAPAFESVVDEEGDQAWQCTVYAEDEMGGGAAWGIATQKKNAKRKNGGDVPDTFAKNKALSKAQRNAKLALIPARLKADIIAALTSAQIKRIQAKPAPPPPGQQLSDEAFKIVLDAIGNAKPGTDRLRMQLVALGAQNVPAGSITEGAIRSLTEPQAADLVKWLASLEVKA